VKTRAANEFLPVFMVSPSSNLFPRLALTYPRFAGFFTPTVPMVFRTNAMSLLSAVRKDGEINIPQTKSMKTE